MKTYTVLLTLVFASFLTCQEPDDPTGLIDLGVCGNGVIPRTNEQWLACRSVEPGKQNLLKALADRRPDVRSMAAQTLAQNRQYDGLAAIAAAFSAEKAPGTRAVMAFALALLGEKQGLAELKNICKSLDASTGVRISAAEYLEQLNDDGWIDGLIAVLQSAKISSLPPEPRRDSGLRAGLVGLATVLPLDRANSRQLEEIRGLADDYLSNGSSDLRIAASQVLAKFGDRASASKLEVAIAREKDSGVRTHMESDLEKLRAARH